MTTSYRLRSGRGSHIRAVRKSCHMAKLGGGLRPPSEASPQDAVRAAGRPRAGPRASEASHPEIAPAKPALERGRFRRVRRGLRPIGDRSSAEGGSYLGDEAVERGAAVG